MKDKKFTLEQLDEMVKEVSNSNLVSYDDLPQYDLFLSQVIDYLNDKFEGEKYTNNIVQNYIKSEVISKPEDGKKRGYTKFHLAQLALVSYMRPILTTEEIKKVFRLAFNEINIRDDDIISWEDAYKMFSSMQQEYFEKFVNQKYFNTNKLNNFLNDNNLEDEDREKIAVFLSVITLIAQASGIKKLVAKIIKEYGE